MTDLKYLNKGKKITLEELLDRKEKRQRQIDSLLDKSYLSVVIKFSLNIPGSIKNNEFIKKIFNFGLIRLKNKLSKENIPIIKSMTIDENTGPEFICQVKSSSRKLKKICIEIEEEKTGRIFDLDVETTKGAISREDLGLKPRTCFLCSEKVDICRRKKTHSLRELLTYIEDLYEGVV